jgi:hypothetical protein
MQLTRLSQLTMKPKASSPTMFLMLYCIVTLVYFLMFWIALPPFFLRSSMSYLSSYILTDDDK